MEIGLVVISLGIMFVGFIGTFLPAIPGAGLIFITGLVYAIITGFENISVITIVILGILAIATIILDNVTSLITTKKVGASKYGIMGALLGGVIGFLSFSFIGLILGQFIGAIVGELLIKKQFKDSLKVGIATFIGYLIGVVLNSTIAMIMIVIFIFAVII